MLITAAQVADTLPGLSPTDSLLTRIVSDTDALARRALGRQFEYGTYALIETVASDQTVLLRESPIRRIVSASVGGNAVDISWFVFNDDPVEDDNRVIVTGVTAGSRLLLNVEAGWFTDATDDHAADLPESIRGRLITRARAQFKRESGVADEETKLMTDEYILKSLVDYARQAWYG